MTDGDLLRARRTLRGMASTSAESRWRLSSVGNRVMWAVVAAFLTWLVFHGAVLPIAVGLVVFAVLTAVVASRR